MKTLLLLALATLAFAQDESPRYFAQKETALSGAAEKVTVQQPSASPRPVFFEAAVVYCSVACDITFSWNGTAATTTTLATTAYPFQVPSTAQAFSASNVGGGTTGPKYSLTAGQTVTFDMTKLFMGGQAVANVSIGTSTITGTVRIMMQWKEPAQ